MSLRLEFKEFGFPEQFSELRINLIRALKICGQVIKLSAEGVSIILG